MPCSPTMKLLTSEADRLTPPASSVPHSISAECKAEPKRLKVLARPEGFRTPTPRFVVWCSIQLSYGRCLRYGPSEGQATASRRARPKPASTNGFTGERKGLAGATHDRAVRGAELPATGPVVALAHHSVRQFEPERRRPLAVSSSCELGRRARRRARPRWRGPGRCRPCASSLEGPEQVSRAFAGTPGPLSRHLDEHLAPVAPAP